MVRYFFLFLLLVLFPFNVSAGSPPIFTQAKIVSITDEKSEVTAVKQIRKKIKILMIENQLKGKTFEVSMIQAEGRDLNFHQGDQVIVSYEKSPEGKENVFIIDYVRNKELLTLFFLFLGFVFLIGRWKGITSFAGMVFSFIVIVNFIIPNIMMGNDPVLIALLGSLFILPMTFYLAHGMNKKTTIALIGTFISLIITGALAYLFVIFARLTGFASEEAAYLPMIQGAAINIRNLLLAGIIISAMGVLDDITISQTAIVERLSIANPKYRFKELYMHAMEVGRDHIASLVNTLVLVYTGAALPLFLLFYNAKISYFSVINQEVITTEIVRTLVSSIGIIAAVPITTLIAGMMIRKKG